MAPRTELATLLETAASDADVLVDVYSAPPAILSVPALVIRPDSPWRTANSQRDIPFSGTGEHYAVVAVVQAGGDPGSLVDTLRDLVVLVEGVDGPWKWEATDGIVQATENGIDYLAATVRLTYLEG